MIHAFATSSPLVSLSSLASLTHQALPLLGFNLTLFPPQASSNAVSVDNLYFVLLGFSVIVVLMVMAMVLGFGIRYRAKSLAVRTGRIVNTAPYELTLIIVFITIGLGIFTWAAKLYFHIQRPPAHATTYYVVAKQWMWKIWHPGGQEEINSLHVPLGREIKLVMTSQDVIHSFFIPAFRVKQDVLPEQYTTLWFKAIRPGTYHLYCSQYCGTEHSSMTGNVVVMKPADYQRWLSGQNHKIIAGLPGGADSADTTDPNALADARYGVMFTQGQLAFTRFGCNACHTQTSDVRAPRLDGIFGRPIRLSNGQTVIADEQYIRESILLPDAKISSGYAHPSRMPSYKNQVSEKDLAELTSFIQSIRDGWPVTKTQDGGAPQPATTTPANKEESKTPPQATPNTTP